VEESKKKIDHNNLMVEKSPKRFVAGGSPRSLKKPTENRIPATTSNKVTTVNKIKRMEQQPKTPIRKQREGFKSPAAQRKAPLISDKTGRNTEKEAFRSARRSRKERKAIVEKNGQSIPVQKQTQNAPHQAFEYGEEPTQRFEYNNELSNTLNSEIQEVECPAPTPVPQRFSQMSKGKPFDDYKNNYNRLSEGQDLDDMQEAEETDFFVNEDRSSLEDKLPVERQSITNSKVFSMSETSFQQFDKNNDTSNFLLRNDSQINQKNNQNESAQ